MAQNAYTVRDLRGFLARPRPRVNMDAIRIAYQLPVVPNETDPALRARLDQHLATLNQDDAALWQPVAPAQPAPAGAAQAAPVAAGAAAGQQAGAQAGQQAGQAAGAQTGAAAAQPAPTPADRNWLLPVAAVLGLILVLAALVFLTRESRSSNEQLGAGVASAASSAKSAADSVATLSPLVTGASNSAQNAANAVATMSPKVDLIGSNVVAMATAVEENKTKVDGLSKRFEGVEANADDALEAASKAQSTADQALAEARNGSNAAPTPPAAAPTPATAPTSAAAVPTPPVVAGAPTPQPAVSTPASATSPVAPPPAVAGDWQTAHFGRLERLDPTFRSGGWTAWLAAAGVSCETVRDARQPEEETNSSTGKISVSGLQVEAKGCHVRYPNIVTTDVPSRIVSKDADAFQYQPDPSNGSVLYTNVTATGPVTIWASAFSWGQFSSKFGFEDKVSAASAAGAAPAVASTPAPAAPAAATSGDKCYSVAELDSQFGIDRGAQGAQQGLLVEGGAVHGAVLRLTPYQVQLLESEGWVIQGTNPAVKSAWSPEGCRPLKN